MMTSFLFIAHDIISIYSLLRPVILVICRSVFFAGGFHWIETRGRRAECHEAPVLALAPHSSYVDALVIVFLDLSSVVAKQHLESAIIFGSMLLFLLFLNFFSMI